MTTASSGAESLAGKTIVITGASDGIGRVAAQRLSDSGAHVVMVGRNAAKTEAAARAIMSANGRRNITWEIADLTNSVHVHELAAKLRSRLTKIDVLINNAGAIYAQRTVTSAALERTFALNHLAYFTLTLLLLDRVYAASTRAEPARIIVVSSEAHRRGKLDFNDLQLTRSFRPWRAYQNSKLDNLLFTRALDKRLDTSRVVVQALHPGVVATRFAVSGNGAWGRFMRWLMNVRSITPAEGADTMIWLSTNVESARLSGGYYMRRSRREPSVAAQNDADAERLWAESAKLSGLDANALAEGAKD